MMRAAALSIKVLLFKEKNIPACRLEGLVCVTLTTRANTLLNKSFAATQYPSIHGSIAQPREGRSTVWPLARGLVGRGPLIDQVWISDSVENQHERTVSVLNQELLSFA